MGLKQEPIARDNLVPKVKKIPGPKAKKWTKFHLKYAATTTLVEGFVWDRTKPAIGPFCTDPDGNVILDFCSHVASAPLGYNHPRLIDLLQKIKQVDPDRYAGADFIAAYGDDPKKSPIPTPSHLHHKIIEITKQFKFDTAFFTNSGAEAVENAIKICYDSRRNNGYGICFDGAFHGRTLGALSLNRSKDVHRKFYPQIPKVVSLPYMTRSDDCGKTLKKLITGGVVKAGEVSYVIIEPLQGEGGYRIPDREFIREVYEEAQKHNIPVISDEIQAGVGRTGKWWACEHWGVKPDVISAGKALRVGATIGKRKSFPKEEGRISSTWGEGNAIASAVAYETINIIQREQLVHNAEKVGNYFLQRLRELNHDRIIDVRGLGLMDAMELDSFKTLQKLRAECFKRGLLVLGTGTKALRFLPPLNVRKREIDLAVDIIEQSLKKIR